MQKAGLGRCRHSSVLSEAKTSKIELWKWSAFKNSFLLQGMATSFPGRRSWAGPGTPQLQRDVGLLRPARPALPQAGPPTPCTCGTSCEVCPWTPLQVRNFTMRCNTWPLFKVCYFFEMFSPVISPSGFMEAKSYKTHWMLLTPMWQRETSNP